MRRLLVILRWHTARVRRVAERLDAQLEAPVLQRMDRDLAELIAGRAPKCRHHPSGCPTSCSWRGAA